MASLMTKLQLSNVPSISNSPIFIRVTGSFDIHDKNYQPILLNVENIIISNRVLQNAILDEYVTSITFTLNNTSKIVYVIETVDEIANKIKDARLQNLAQSQS